MQRLLPCYDTHVHSHMSGHSEARMTPDNVMAAAKSRRLDGLVMLEHLPQIFPGEPASAWYSRKNDRLHLDALYSAIGDSGGVKVVKGVEIDPDPVKLDGSLMLDDFSTIDFPVFATHVLPGGKTFWFSAMPMPAPVAEQVLEEYLTMLKKALSQGQVKAWAHPGATIAKAALLKDFSRESIEPLEEVFAIMSERGVAFELNELLAKKLEPPYITSYPQLVDAARAWGIRFVVGSDAHSPENVGVYKWVEAVAWEACLTREDFLDVVELAGDTSRPCASS